MKAEDEIEEILAQNMHYHQPSFIAGFKKGKESQLQALKEKGEKFFDECWHMNKNEFLNLITNLEDNG